MIGGRSVCRLRLVGGLPVHVQRVGQVEAEHGNAVGNGQAEQRHAGARREHIGVLVPETV